MEKRLAYTKSYTCSKRKKNNHKNKTIQSFRYLTEAKECRGCSWPVCGDHCPFKSTHTSQECNLLAKKR